MSEEATGSSTERRATGSQRPVSVPRDAKDVARAVNTMAWPVILENIFQTALGTVNMIMVSSLGAIAVAAVGTATQVVFVVNAGFAAVTTGTTVLVARFWGAGDKDGADHITKQSLVLGLVVSVVLGIIGFVTAEPVIRALGAEESVVRSGASYLRITMASSPVLLGMFILSGALRGAGDTKSPMMVTGIINLVNIAASYVLIYGVTPFPALGVDGAGYAAAFSRLIGTGALLAILMRKKEGILSIRGSHGWSPDASIYWRITKVGTPSMLEQLGMSGGMLIYGVIAISMGTVLYAAQRITFQALSISMMPGMGFAMAATAMVGQCLGAGRPDLSEKSAWYSVKMAAIWMSLMGVTMVVFGEELMLLFTRDPEMVRMGKEGLMVIAIAQPFMAIGMVLAGALRGAGDTRFPMYVTTAAIWLVRLPFAYLFGPVMGFGLAGLYVSNALDSGIRAAAQVWRYRSGRWRDIEI